MKDPSVTDGDMAAAVGAHEWSGTPLGPADRWPASLRTAVNLVLGCQFPMLLLWGPELVQIYNDGYREIMAGWRPCALGRPARECRPETWRAQQPVYSRVLTGEAVTLADQRFTVDRHGRQEEVWFTLCHSPVRDESRGVAGVLVTAFETTARFRAEALRRVAETALRASEARQAFLLKLNNTLRPLADPVEIQFAAVRELGLHLGAGRAGYAECEDDGKTLVIARHYAGGLPSIEGRYRLADFGATLPSDLLCHPAVVRADVAHDPELSGAEKAAFAAPPLGAIANFPLVKEGRMVAVLFVHYREAHDFTPGELSLMEAVAERIWAAIEQERAEQARRESEERLRAAARAARFGTYDANLVTGARFWSPEMRAILGVAADAPPPPLPEVPEFIHPEDAGRVREMLARVINDPNADAAIVHEHRIVRPDGSVRWVQLRGEVQFTGEGPDRRPVRNSGVLLDITELKQAEERLRQAHKLESLGLLAGGVAHDFNNLLVGVIGSASLAKEFLTPDHPAFELLDSVIRSGEGAAHLTRQMLAYSGKGKFVIEALNLSTFVPDHVGLALPAISRKIALRFDLAGDLPPVEADRGQLEQIFVNLVVNAAEAIGDSDGRIAIRTGVQNVNAHFLRQHPDAGDLRPGEYVVLEVRDSGCGMDEATRSKIFDPFFTTKFLGRGLGLAAVAGIVRGHDAAILVASTPGRGSCFTVLFPASKRRLKTPSADGSSAARLHGTGVVLVVDDEPLVRDLARQSLARYGYTVLVAESGPAAIETLREHGADVALVVLDLSMHGLSGEETLPELRKIDPSVRVLVSSGYSESEVMQRFSGQNVSGFVQKPYTAVELARKVRLALT